jgi:hypothetical protein
MACAELLDLSARAYGGAALTRVQEADLVHV